MKIGILTQALNNNFGGILQNYALQTVLRSMNYEVVTLNWDMYRSMHNHDTFYSIFFQIIKTFVSRSIFRKKRNYYWQQRKIYYLLAKNNKLFVDNYIITSHWLWGKKMFRDYVVNNKIDILIVGSDQTWRPRYNLNGMLYRMYLDFSDKLMIKRIAYSVSFGVDCWEYSHAQTLKCSELIKRFDAISVREYSGSLLCEQYLKIPNVPVTLDPTMLLNEQDYLNILNKEMVPLSSGRLFVYMLDYSAKKKDLIDMVSKQKGLSCSMFISKYCNLGMVDENSIDYYTSPSVLQWLRSISDSEFVICDSFHGLVFSIIFKKRFLVICNENRGTTRLHSILHLFNLENRLIDENSEDGLQILYSPIDWDVVNVKRERLIEQSLVFLQNALSD